MECWFAELTITGPNNLRTDLSRYENKVHPDMLSNLHRKKSQHGLFSFWNPFLPLAPKSFINLRLSGAHDSMVSWASTWLVLCISAVYPYLQLKRTIPTT